MPFTASHVAAVLPLTRSRLIPAALVVGSMVPDLPYFVSLPLTAHTTHSLVGVLSVDVLAGLIVLAVWQVLLAGRLHRLAPSSVQRRLPAPQARPGWVRRLPLAYLSLVVGGLTHIAWDSFTHEDRWGAQHIAWLVEEHGPMDGAGWAQYGSTLLGATILAGWLVRWWRRTPPSYPPAQSRAGSSTWLLPRLVAATVTICMASPVVVDNGTAAQATAALAVKNGSSLVLGVVLCVAFVSSRPWQQRGAPDLEVSVQEGVDVDTRASGGRQVDDLDHMVAGSDERLPHDSVV